MQLLATGMLGDPGATEKDPGATEKDPGSGGVVAPSSTVPGGNCTDAVPDSGNVTEGTPLSIGAGTPLRTGAGTLSDPEAGCNTSDAGTYRGGGMRPPAFGKSSWHAAAAEESISPEPMALLCSSASSPEGAAPRIERSVRA